MNYAEFMAKNSFMFVFDDRKFDVYNAMYNYYILVDLGGKQIKNDEFLFTFGFSSPDSPLFIGKKE